MEVLLTSYCDWTEYTLYLLAAEQADAVSRYHLWADDTRRRPPTWSGTPGALSIWDCATATAGRMPGAAVHLGGPRPVRSGPEQAAAIRPSEVAVVAAKPLPRSEHLDGGPAQAAAGGAAELPVATRIRRGLSTRRPSQGFVHRRSAGRTARATAGSATSVRWEPDASAGERHVDGASVRLGDARRVPGGRDGTWCHRGRGCAQVHDRDQVPRRTPATLGHRIPSR